MKMIIIKNALIFILCLSLSLSLCACASPDLEDAEECLTELTDELTVVAKFLSDYEYDDISITDADGTMTLLLKETVAITDEIVVESIKSLFDSGIKSIYKSKEDNAIGFLRWTKFNDFGAGLVYSINSEVEPSVIYQTKLVLLSKEGWYYYESDFNEWRIIHKSQESQ